MSERKTLRDELAMAALTGLMAGPGAQDIEDYVRSQIPDEPVGRTGSAIRDVLTAMAYDYADAMLAARKVKP